MAFKATLGMILVTGLSVAAQGQTAADSASLPGDPLELVSGQTAVPTQLANNPESRASVVDLLNRARKNYSLRGGYPASQTTPGYDLKVSFTVNSGGQTEFDGDWLMEDVFDPNLGLRWIAKTGTAYAITHISAGGKSWSDGGANYIPLRLHEARAALFGSIPSADDIRNQSIRTTTASFQGKQVTCILLAGSAVPKTPSPARRWEETEECIDPQSGLLQVHSQVPGRYFSYDYSDAPQIAGHIVPRKITVTEAGKVVSVITVDSLTEIPAADPSLFAPPDTIRANGRAITLAGAEKVVRPAMPTTTLGPPVCVFGLVTSSGKLVDAHSLQPSNPNSQAAVEAVGQMTFSQPTIGPQPQQRFVFIITTFGGNNSPGAESSRTIAVSGK